MDQKKHDMLANTFMLKQCAFEMRVRFTLPYVPFPCVSFPIITRESEDGTSQLFLGSVSRYFMNDD